MTIKIRYHGYSRDLSHPGDRRRVGILKNDENFKIVTPDAKKYDITLLSSNANYSHYLTSTSKCPIVIDLIDGYLALKDKVLQDFARNILRSMNGQSRFSDLKFTTHIERNLSRASGCIVPSIEIANQVYGFSPKIDIILDNHSEIASVNYNPRASGILWEGFGSNLKHLRECSDDLGKILDKYDLTLYVVTDEAFFRFGNKIIQVDTMQYLKKLFPKVYQRIKLKKWSIENLREAAQNCKLAIIPINKDDVFGKSKCENKLLAMWTLGIPTIASDTFAYNRVMKETFQEDCLVQSGNWHKSLESALENQLTLQKMRETGLTYVSENHQESQLIEKWRTTMISYLK